MVLENLLPLLSHYGARPSRVSGASARGREALTQDYNADGIMLDSYGWQMNLPMRTETLEVVIERWPFRWNAGVLDLMDRVRDVMGSNKVLLVETSSGPVGWHFMAALAATSILGFISKAA